tara:strand:+ start:3345 stop:4526 length:1182 start_codon:yes stop_codon:yes gene_type:complete
MKKIFHISKNSILAKRLRKFKSLKRAYFSLIILISLYAFSILSPLLINSKPILVKYEGSYYSPLFTELFTNDFYEAKFFGQDSIMGRIKYGEPHYRILQKTFRTQNNGNFIIMPLYPYDPYEDVLSELDEQYTDLNGNNKWDTNEPFVDSNKDGKLNQYRPATFPDSIHIMGTDNQGRDVLARLIYGFRISITFALIVTIFSYTIGIFMGGILGFYGGKIDLFGLRLIEIYASIPFLFVLMILGNFIKPNIYILASMYIILSGWVGICWYIRGEFYREKAKDYVSAAISMGQSNIKVMFKHILPNALTPVITFAPFAIIGYIAGLVSLDYLGFGLQPPTPSWGELFSQGAANLQYWHLVIFPMGAMGGTLFLITFIGEGIREAFDPKVHSRLR